MWGFGDWEGVRNVRRGSSLCLEMGFGDWEGIRNVRQVANFDNQALSSLP